MRHDGVRSNDRVATDRDAGQDHGADPDPTAILQGHGAAESVSLEKNRRIRIRIAVVGVADEYAIGDQDMAADSHAAPRVDLREASDRRVIADPQRWPARRRLSSLALSQARSPSATPAPTWIKCGSTSLAWRPSRERAPHAANDLRIASVYAHVRILSAPSSSVQKRVHPLHRYTG